MRTETNGDAWDPVRSAVLRANHRPTVVLLDCNAVNYLVRPPRHMGIDVATTVSRLDAAVNDGRLLCLATCRLLEQIGGTAHSDPEKMHRMFALLRRLSREQLLPSGADCVRTERLADRRLDIYDLCIPPEKSAAIWDRLDGLIENEPGLSDANREVALNGAMEAAICASEIDEFRALAGGKGRATAAIDDEHADRDSGVAQCYEHSVKTMWVRQFGDDDLPWPPIERLPSLWNYTAFLLARLQLVSTRRISPHEGDEGDAMLYADAAYAEVLVTDDASLRRIVANIGPRALPTMTLAEFVAAWA